MNTWNEVESEGISKRFEHIERGNFVHDSRVVMIAC